MSSASRRTSYLLWSKARIFVALALVFFVAPANQSFASPYDSPPYTNSVFNCTTGIGCCAPTTPQLIVKDAITGTMAFSGRDLQNYYYMNTLWPKIEQALKELADELRNASLLPIGITGSMIDAQNFNQTLVSLEKQTTSTLVSQAPSDQICRFGTLSRSLAQSDDKARVAQLGLANQMMRRELMHKGMASAFEEGVGKKLGRASDKISRFDLYKKSFCDPKDSNGTLGAGWCTSTIDDRRNKDIEVTRSFYNPLTLKIDFSSTAELGNMTADEENLFAMGSNLFAHDLPINMEQADFQSMTKDNGKDTESKKGQLMDYRALTAKRSVAQNSFAALAAMKAAGSSAASPYLKAMVAELGLDVTSQNAILGQNPSYYAQMELLTRKLYQSPAFYANLMESNSNIARQQTAMEGIGLMQDRDIHESLRRSEMVLSTLLEMYVMREQDSFKDSGTK